MTEHLKKQLEDAASKLRSAKGAIESKSSEIQSLQGVIGENERAIAAHKQCIGEHERNIWATRDAIQKAKNESANLQTKAFLAESRLAFFNNELVDHPYAAA